MTHAPRTILSSSAACCAAGRPVAADPVSPRPGRVFVEPTNRATAGRKGLLCQRPCRWRRGVRAARNRVAAWSRSPGDPCTGTIPGTAVSVLVGGRREAVQVAAAG
jgi:hypothetical protein